MLKLLWNDVHWKQLEIQETNLGVSNGSLPVQIQNQMGTALKNFQRVLQGIPYEVTSSGTSSAPKSVIASYTRPVEQKENRNAALWICGFHPDSFAALDVLLQSYKSGFYFFSWAGAPEELQNLPKEFTLKNISFTPTQLRLLVGVGSGSFVNFNNVFLSGERVSERDFEVARKLFPGATVQQIFGLSEFGALMGSTEPTFTLDSANSKFLSFDSAGELFVLTSKGKLSTGDLFQEDSPGKWTYIGRIDRSFKVAGMMVHPEMVEQVLEQIPSVCSALVFARQSPLTGNVVAAEIVLEQGAANSEAEAELWKISREKLARHEVPQFFSFADKIQISERGKKKGRNEK